MLRITLAHVQYRQHGGEDAVVDRDEASLKALGESVTLLQVSNDALDTLHHADWPRLAVGYPYHRYGREAMERSLAESPADVVHFHNIHPFLGLGAVLAARESGAATVFTVHNYRTDCISGNHYRAGHICEVCSYDIRTPGVVHACYRSSRLQSAVMAHGSKALWLAMRKGLFDAVICLDAYVLGRLRKAGIPEAVLHIRANGVPVLHAPLASERSGAICVARLVPEKGVLELVRAWQGEARLTVVGGGPLEAAVRDAASGRNITVSGSAAAVDVLSAVSHSRVAVVPSMWYEGGYPLTAQEALSAGTPVACFDLGCMSGNAKYFPDSTVRNGDFEELVESASEIATCDSARWAGLSRQAQRAHLQNYEEGLCAEALLDVYVAALERRIVFR